VVGLEPSTDDYIAKPFRMRELLARVAAAPWRACGANAETAGEVMEQGADIIVVGGYGVNVSKSNRAAHCPRSRQPVRPVLHPERHSAYQQAGRGGCLAAQHADADRD